MKYYKITNKKEIHNDLKYKTGLVVDPVPFNPTGSCYSGGIYFSNAENITEFLYLGQWIREVLLPEDARIYQDPEGNKLKADKIILLKRRSLKKIDTWKWIKKEGIKLEKYSIIWALSNGYLEIVKFLIDEGVECVTNAIEWATLSGSLELVKFLIGEGFAPTEHSVIWARSNKQLDIARLLENGLSKHN